jgi:hypothetical protein
MAHAQLDLGIGIVARGDHFVQAFHQSAQLIAKCIIPCLEPFFAHDIRVGPEMAKPETAADGYVYVANGPVRRVHSRDDVKVPGHN